eukprot:scaffold106_cov380-Prasinococcus_capsulatus_cf.AAC.33
MHRHVPTYRMPSNGAFDRNPSFKPSSQLSATSLASGHTNIVSHDEALRHSSTKAATFRGPKQTYTRNNGTGLVRNGSGRSTAAMHLQEEQSLGLTKEGLGDVLGVQVVVAQIAERVVVVSVPESVQSATRTSNTWSGSSVLVRGTAYRNSRHELLSKNPSGKHSKKLWQIPLHTGSTQNFSLVMGARHPFQYGREYVQSQEVCVAGQESFLKFKQVIEVEEPAADRT